MAADARVGVHEAGRDTSVASLTSIWRRAMPAHSSHDMYRSGLGYSSSSLWASLGTSASCLASAASADWWLACPSSSGRLHAPPAWHWTCVACVVIMAVWSRDSIPYLTHIYLSTLRYGWPNDENWGQGTYRTLTW